MIKSERINGKTSVDISGDLEDIAEEVLAVIATAIEIDPLREMVAHGLGDLKSNLLQRLRQKDLS